MKNNKHEKSLSLRSVFHLCFRYFTLAILATIVLSGCGSGGGGGGGSAGNNPPANSAATATAVIGASGGSVNLSDGTTVVIDAGVVQDGTTITVTSESAPASTSPGITPISAVIKVTIPAGSLLQSPASGVDGISVQIPVTSQPSAVSAVVAAASQSGLASTSYRYIKATLKTGTNQIAYYGKLAADATVATGKLTYNTVSNFGQAVGDQYLKGIQLIAEFNAELIQPNVSTAGQLFEVRDGSLSDGSFVDSLSPAHSNVPSDKLPLVLVHGIVSLGSNGLGCDGGAKSYKKTWEEFIKFFYSEEHQVSSELRKRFQLYTFSYQTDKSIEGNGQLFATAVKATFGGRPVVVVGHSMGGLVTRSAMVHWKEQIGANIGGVITLGTPHHGTVVAEDIAAVADKLLCFDATDAKGALDLRWDSFNNPSLGCTNGFLCGPNGLNTIDQNQSKYITYAGELGDNPFACANPFGILTNFFDSLLLCGKPGLALTTLGPVIGFGNDGIVPKQSASFAEYDSSAFSNFFMRDNTQLRRSPRVFSGIQHISIHDSHLIFHGDKDDHLNYATPNVAQDLLDFYNSLISPAVNATGITNGATGVAVNSAISVTFSEALDASTITTSTFTLNGPSGLVTGTVAYNTTTNTAVFTPSAALAYSSIYTATITTGVKDLVGSPLASNYSWSFTTGAGSAPSVPTGINATAGNGQVTISWNAAAGVTYNLYMASVYGVTKSTYSGLPDGMKHSGVTSPYVHTGLTNGKTYYFVVTAVNANGESSESSQVSATPQATSIKVWGAPQLIETGDAGDAKNQQIAMNASGTAIGVWSQSDGASFNIYANRYVPANGWGTAVLIETGTGNAESPQIAVAADGSAIAVWRQSDGIRYNILANRYDPISGWGTATVIETNANDAEAPQVAIDATGVAIVVWRQSDGTRNNIYANRYNPASGWGAVVLIETSALNVQSPQIAMAANGSAIAVWRQNDGDPIYSERYSIYTNRYDPASGWGTAALVETNDVGTTGDGFDIAMNENGAAVVVWRQWGGGSSWGIYANQYNPSSGWGTAAIIGSADSNLTSPKVAMNANGYAMAVWCPDIFCLSYLASHYDPASGWGSASSIMTTPVGAFKEPAIAMDANDNVVAAWLLLDLVTFQTLNVNYYTHGSGWGTPMSLSNPLLTLASDYSSLAMDANGNAVVLSLQIDISNPLAPTHVSVYATHYK